jgi:hypothetical protein
MNGLAKRAERKKNSFTQMVREHALGLTGWFPGAHLLAVVKKRNNKVIN